MPLRRDSHRIVIAGASSLLGAELKSLLEESRFAGWDFSLVDEESAAGTLTEAAGEPALIQPVAEGTFDGATLVFFSGSAAFTERNLSVAQNSGAIIVDLSGAMLKLPHARTWFSLSSDALDQTTKLNVIPSAPGLVAARLLDTFSPLGMNRLAITFFRPVSEAGRAGIEELEAQTSQLLSFQSAGQPLFDTQVAFTMLDHYGAASRENLQLVRDRVRSEVALAAAANSVKPSIQILHVPVFYGYTFVAIADLNLPRTRDAIVELCRKAGFSLDSADGAPIGNLTASGDSGIHLAFPDAGLAQASSWWLWGAADNVRLPAVSAVKVAEKLLAGMG